MTSSRRDTIEVTMAYAAFLHDRLATCAPGYVALRIDGPPSDLASPSLVVTRRDIGDGNFELIARIDPQPVRSGRDLSVPALRKGEVVGGVAYVVPADAVENEAMERQLRRYLLAGAAALVYDLPEDRWPSEFPDDFEAVALHDMVGGAHLERVGAYAHIIVRALHEPLGLTDEFGDATFSYAPFHDIGQALMGDDILRKPGRLDPDEWRFMQTHTTRGRDIIDAAIAAAPEEWQLPDVLRNVVEFHHEALDGTGYPHGLSGAAVPLEARIVSVADVFDALTSSRPYKPGWSANEALEEMDRMIVAGKLDPLCVTALVTQPDLVEVVAASGREGGVPIGHTR
jgi:HD-GYP domain-containing protein (c-di-GMP phosphodiesterase class II)